ncbi:MAG: acyl-CoA thioesterase FadM [Planctomycetota bacterium]|jgi:acyl-CoA thioesterase FadM
MQNPEVPSNEDLSLRVRMHTRWSDEDNQSVLNNAVYMTLFEEARHAYFSGLDLLDANRFPFVLLQTNVRFVAPGSGGVDVEVALGTTHLGRSSFTQAYRVRECNSDGSVGAIWCEAEAVLVAWDATRRSGRPMEEDFRAAIARFEAQAKG